MTTFDKSQLAVATELAKKWRLLDLSWYNRIYKETFSTVDEAIDDLLAVDRAESRNPNPLFDGDFYKKQYRAEVGNLQPFLHYLLRGNSESYAPHRLIEPSLVSKQLASAGSNDMVLSALLHKMAALELDPHPLFSTKYYLSRYSEIRDRRIHPLIHYLRHGANELRAPHPLFWPDWYMSHVDRSVAPESALLHYNSNQASYLIPPNPYFDPDWYLDSYKDVRDAGVNPLFHYLRFGASEGRSPNPNLDVEWFNQTYSRSLRVTKWDPLTFLVLHGNGHVAAGADGRQLRLASGTNKKEVAKLQEKIAPSLSAVASRRRLLFISHNLRLQGAQTSLFELARGMSGSPNYDVHVMAPDDGPMKDKYDSAGIPVHKFRLPVAGMSNEIDYLKLLKQFEQGILDLSPDVVHGNTVQAYHALAAAARHNIPTVWNIRESEDPTSHSNGMFPAAKGLFDEALNAVRQYVFVSSATQALWKAHYPSIQASTVQNGIDYRNMLSSHRITNRSEARASFGIPDGSVMILNVGTWTDRKGQKDVVQALPTIHRRFWPNLHLVLIGANASSYAEQVREEIALLPTVLRDRVAAYDETHGLAERVRVLSAYMAADLFVFTSRIESYPRVVNEAMWFGLPVVTTPCFGVVEQIEPEVSGKFYQEGKPVDLGGKIEELLAHPDERAKLGNSARWCARHRVIQYDQMLSRYDSIYHDLWRA